MADGDFKSLYNLRPVAPAPAAAAATEGDSAPSFADQYKLRPVKDVTKEQPSIIKRIGGWLYDTAVAAKDAVVGQNEFDYPELTADPPNGLDLGRLMMARDENAMLDVLKKDRPDVRTSKDKFGNLIVDLDGKNYYLNRSGVSGRDIDEFGRDTLMTLPFSAGAGALAGRAAMPFRAAAQAVAGGAGSVTLDAASTAAGSEQGVNFGAMLASMLGGAGGEMLGSAAGAIIEKIRNNPARFVNPQTGNLTPAGIELFGEAGIDVADVSQRLAQNFAARARVTGANAATARETAAAEFRIPMTRGQATGDFDQIAFEQSAKTGARGETAGNVMRNQFDRQATAIEDARRRLGDQFGPGAQNMSPQESADLVRGGVVAREEAHGEMTSAAWSQARELAKDAYIPKADLRELPDVAKNALRSDPRYYTPDDPISINKYPTTLQVMDLFKRWGNLDIGEITTKSGSGVTPQGVAIELMDEFRKMLSGRGGLLSEAQGGDKVRVGAIVKAFNQWLDGVEDDALMRGAKGAEAYAQFKAARKASAKHFELFDERNLPKGHTDKAGATLQRMINEDVNPQEVANWLWGAGKFGDSGDAYRLAQRVKEIVGTSSPEWDAMRRGFWTRMTREAEGKTQPGAQAMSQNILEFVNGKGSALAKVLFNADELSTMRRFAATLKNTLPPNDAMNRGQSGYELGRLMGSIGANIGNQGLPVRMFFRSRDQIRNLGPSVRAATTGTGAPVVRTPASPLLPAASAAVAGEMSRDE